MSPEHQLRRCIAAGTAAAGLIAAAGVVVGPAAGTRRPAVTVAGYAASYGGVVLLVGAWLWLGRIVARMPGRGGRRAVVAALVAWSLPLVCGPVLFSRDVFSYAAQGREVVVGLNPYRYGPAVLGGDPYVRLVSPIWSGTRSPYGPLFLGLDALIVGHAGGHAMAAAGLLRLLACAGVALLAVALPRLASAGGADPAEALWLGVANPLVLLHVVSGGHNDGLMLGLMVAGLACARQRRFAVGLVACLLAAAVKVPAAVAAVYVVLEWLASAPDRAARARAGVRIAAVAGATTVAVTLGAGLGWGWIGTVSTPARVHTPLSVTTVLGQAAGRLAGGVGAPVPAGVVVSALRLAGVGVAVAAGLLLLTGRHRRSAAASVGLTLLAVVALGPVVQPWYLLWGIVPLAAGCPPWLRPRLVWVSAGLCLLVLPGGAYVPGPLVLGFVAATGAVTVRGWRDRPRPVSRPATV